VKLWKLPDQVVRLAGLFIIGAVVLIIVRQSLVPESFGEIGHYRADAVTTVAQQEMRYAGGQVCVECHDDIGEVKAGSFHRLLSCEVCHGPALDHAEAPESSQPAMPRKRGEACLFCHEYLPSRPTGFPQIIERTHNPLEACISCHSPHDPTPPDTPEACSACHARIARIKAVSHHASLDCETCHQVAAEHLTSPRLNPALKPTSRDLCAACHDDDAESSPAIPRIDSQTHNQRYLCWQCHYPHYPEG
jgi:hypothetical protein